MFLCGRSVWVRTFILTFKVWICSFYRFFFFKLKLFCSFLIIDIRTFILTFKVEIVYFADFFYYFFIKFSFFFNFFFIKNRHRPSKKSIWVDHYFEQFLGVQNVLDYSYIAKIFILANVCWMCQNWSLFLVHARLSPCVVSLRLRRAFWWILRCLCPCLRALSLSLRLCRTIPSQHPLLPYAKESVGRRAGRRKTLTSHRNRCRHTRCSSGTHRPPLKARIPTPRSERFPRSSPPCGIVWEKSRNRYKHAFVYRNISTRWTNEC